MATFRRATRCPVRSGADLPSLQLQENLRRSSLPNAVRPRPRDRSGTRSVRSPRRTCHHHHFLRQAFMFRIRSLSRFTVKLVLACAIVSSPAQAVEREAPANSSHTLLQGGVVEHSVTLPALPDEIRIGKPLAPVESSIKQQDQKYIWYKVAPWMAGTWQT